jgi:hypothetical protein
MVVLSAIATLGLLYAGLLVYFMEVHHCVFGHGDTLLTVLTVSCPIG